MSASVAHAQQYMGCKSLLKLNVNDQSQKISGLQVLTKKISSQNFYDLAKLDRFRRIKDGILRFNGNRYAIGSASEIPSTEKGAYGPGDRQFIALAIDGQQYALTPIFDWDRSNGEPSVNGEIYFNGSNTLIIHYKSYKTKNSITSSIDNYLSVMIEQPEQS